MGQAPVTTAQGAPDIFFGTDPAAGSNYTFTIPLGTVWHLSWAACQLVTGAAVAVRTVQLEILAGAVFWRSIGTVTQAASLTYTYGWFPGIIASAAVDAVGWVGIVLPSNLVLATTPTISLQMRIKVTNLQAADQIQGEFFGIYNGKNN